MAAGAAADLASGDVTADVVFRSVGVQGDFGALQHHQQFGLVGVKPHQQAIEGDEAGLLHEAAIEPRLQRCLAFRGGSETIGLEVGVEIPDLAADGSLSSAALVGEGVELVNEAFGVHPAQTVLADIELAGVVADDDGLGKQAVRLDAAPQSAFGGDHHGVRVDFQRGDPERIEVRAPGLVIGEPLVAVLGQTIEHVAGQLLSPCLARADTSKRRAWLR